MSWTKVCLEWICNKHNDNKTLRQISGKPLFRFLPGTPRKNKGIFRVIFRNQKPLTTAQYSWKGKAQKRENNKPEIYNTKKLRKKEKGEQCFIEYFRKLNKRKASNHDNWVSALNYIEAFTNGKLKFADLNEKFLEDLIPIKRQNNFQNSFILIKAH